MMTRHSYQELYESLRHKLNQERGDRAAAEAQLWKTQELLKDAQEKLAYAERRAKDAEASYAWMQQQAEKWQAKWEEADRARMALMNHYVYTEEMVHAS